MAHIVVIPGWRQTSDHWAILKNNLSAHTVDIIDLPGFGKVPLVSDEWGIPEYAEYVADQIAILGYSDIILLGHSFGGRVTSYLASSRPLWLKGIILFASPSIYRPVFKVRMLAIIAKIAKTLGIKRKFIRSPDVMTADNLGLGKIVRKVIPFDQTALLPKINVPTLLIWGRQDDAVRLKIAEEMNHLIPHSKLVVIDNAGHNLHIYNQSILYGTITQFLKNL